MERSGDALAAWWACDPVSDMMRGEFANLSERERELMGCLTMLDFDIEIKVRPAKAGIGHLLLATA